MQEKEKIRRLKTDIRSQAKTKVRQISKEHREEMFEQGRKEGKEDFLRKMANNSDIQRINAI